jgi:Ni,Fe-hydrogenase I cytochrome b subunit
MVQIKAWLLSIDAFWLLVSGYSFIDIASTLATGNLAMSSFENFIKLLLSMAGFVYLCARTYHFIIKSSIERDLLREDVIAKQNENHKHNTFGQFREDLKNINHENLKK